MCKKKFLRPPGSSLFLIKSYHNSFSEVKDRKARWGISWKELLPYVLNVDRNFDNHILIILKGGHRIFGSYIPPIYYEDEYFHAVSCFLSPADNDRVFIGGGDWLQTLRDTNASCSADTDTFVYSYGWLLKNIYKSPNCLILNNLNYNEKNVNDLTFEKDGNKSQNDICVTNITELKRVTSFSIHGISCNLSDL